MKKKYFCVLIKTFPGVYFSRPVLVCCLRFVSIVCAFVQKNLIWINLNISNFQIVPNMEWHKQQKLSKQTFFGQRYLCKWLKTFGRAKTKLEKKYDKFAQPKNEGKLNKVFYFIYFCVTSIWPQFSEFNLAASTLLLAPIFQFRFRWWIQCLANPVLFKSTNWGVDMKFLRAQAAATTTPTPTPISTTTTNRTGSLLSWKIRLREIFIHNGAIKRWIFDVSMHTKKYTK